MFKRIFVLGFVLVAAACAPKDTARSGEQPSYRALAPGAVVSFLVLKNGSTPVAGKFTEATGKIDVSRFPELAGELAIDIHSLDTALPERTANVMQYFFSATDPALRYAKFRPARFAGDAVDLAALSSPATGTLEGMLEVAGHAAPVTMPVRLEPAAAGGVHIVSSAPGMVRISALQMEADKARMMEVCKHQSVSDEVQLTVDALLSAAR